MLGVVTSGDLGGKAYQEAGKLFGGRFVPKGTLGAGIQFMIFGKLARIGMKSLVSKGRGLKRGGCVGADSQVGLAWGQATPRAVVVTESSPI